MNVEQWFITMIASSICLVAGITSVIICVVLHVPVQFSLALCATSAFAGQFATLLWLLHVINDAKEKR